MFCKLILKSQRFFGLSGSGLESAIIYLTEVKDVLGGGNSGGGVTIKHVGSLLHILPHRVRGLKERVAKTTSLMLVKQQRNLLHETKISNQFTHI